MLKVQIVKCLKEKFPQINSKTWVIRTDVSSIKITEKTLPEVKHIKRKTYFSTLFKALLSRKIESDVVPHNKKNIRTLFFDEFYCGSHRERTILIVCYDNVSDILYVSKYGYTDIDLNLLE